MSPQTIEDRDVKDPAEETQIVYVVEIPIPITSDSLKCGVRLAPEGDSEGYYLSDWWAEKEGEGSFEKEGELGYDYAENGDVFPFSTHRSAALAAAHRLRNKLAEIDPDDDLKAQDDVRRFMVAAEIGEVPELNEPEPEGDSLPSGESPLSEEDELKISRQFIAENHAQAKEALRLKAIWVDLKAETSVAKKKMENAQDAHAEMSLTRVADLREIFQNDVASRPLIDPTQNPAIDDNQPEPALAEPWRAVLISELSLSQSIVGHLAKNPGHAITTLGELADFEADMCNKGFANPLCGIPEIGASAAAKICEARLEYFRYSAGWCRVTKRLMWRAWKRHCHRWRTARS
ncbi:hypothetical protein LCGC14_0336870 [marine sediment metagenome]|uniref:Uncharacterized protein n=1 Tax=marine sediment metagenome TaxID=412755 RepID=A0A0F9TY13_9ZZZZ